MGDLIALSNAVFDVLTKIFNLYTTTWLLTGVFALWVIRKVVNIFRHLY